MLEVVNIETSYGASQVIIWCGKYAVPLGIAVIE